MSVSDRALQADNRKRHDELCKLFETEFKRFLGHGETLRKIKALGAYKETHKTFEAFVKFRFGIDRTYAHRLIDSAEVKENLLPIGNEIELPQTESQYREVAKAPPEKQAEVVRKVAEKAAEENRKPTAKDYKKLVGELVYEDVESPGDDDEAIAVTPLKGKATLTPEEQTKANRKLAKDYIAKAVNAVDDYHAAKPNQNRRASVVKLLQQAGENLW